jgi:redox-sensing transcriptional repressor
VDVRKVDLSIELQILSFHEQRKASLGAPSLTRLPGGRGAAGADEKAANG